LPTQTRKDLLHANLPLIPKQERAGRLQTALNCVKNRKHELVRLKAGESKEDKENAKKKGEEKMAQAGCCRGSCIRQDEHYEDTFILSPDCPEQCQLHKCPNFLLCKTAYPIWLLDCHGGRCYPCNITFAGNLEFIATAVPEDCAVCLEDHTVFVKHKQCSHVLCTNCYHQLYLNKRNDEDKKDTRTKCPLCREVLKVPQVYGWQLPVIEMIKEKPDMRSIIWVYSEAGARGKSSLAKYLCMKHKAVIVSGAPGDMKYQIISTTKKQDGIAPKIIVMDVPRMQKQICYSGLEQIKNGCFSSPKYKSAMFLMNPPHVVVFANQLPNSTNMSADRFVVITVD
jgi:hypothetical protein